jgi:ATP-dependent RNA helicase MSS116
VLKLTPALTLSHRFYSPAPRLKETEVYDEPESSSPAAEADGSKEVQIVPFDTLRGYVNHDTLKALTFKPFTLSSMSEVQRRVLKLMPYLAGGKLSSVALQSESEGELIDNPDAVENAEGVKRGREDLLVKAKTGTGKTIVSCGSPKMRMANSSCVGFPRPRD